jgi:hypothetical protein
MPLIFALRKSVPTPSSSIEQDDLTEVVYQGLSVGVGVTIIKDSLLIKEGVGITHGPIVISADRRSEPWQIVAVRTSEKEVARYAARVDFALTAVDSGDYSTALALLEDAGAHAPSTLERARSLVLMGQLASMMLNDSIGDLQALSLYHEAFRVWHDVVSTSATQGEVKTPLEQWIRDELSAEFEQYGTAYPEVASALALDPKAVRAAEALRFQKERGEPVANSPEVTAMLNSVSRRFRQYVSSDNAQTWFDAERERLARLDSKSLIEEAKQAVSRGPDEARWFAETLTIIYAGGVGDAEDHRVSMALTTASDGCTEPWRSQFKEYLRASARNLKTMRPSSDVSQEQVELTLESAHRFGLEKTAQVFQAVLATARSQNSPPTAEPLLAGPPPSAAWWTSEYLDWFLATMWNVVSHSHAECDVPSQSCQDMLMRVRPYICFDGSEKHRLFLPGLGVAKWMLLGEPKVDPYWDHAFYFGTGTHFALWQRGL